MPLASTNRVGAVWCVWTVILMCPFSPLRYGQSARRELKIAWRLRRNTLLVGSHTSQAWTYNGAQTSSLLRCRRRGGQSDSRGRAAAAYGATVVEPPDTRSGV